jgi:hypothetical protein
LTAHIFGATIVSRSRCDGPVIRDWHEHLPSAGEEAQIDHGQDLQLVPVDHPLRLELVPVLRSTAVS